MGKSLPPLNAIRAFDAAVRHLSFHGAADELGITDAALAHQIRKLEEHLNVKLFRRLNRSLELTAAGETMAPRIKRGFEILNQGVERLSGDPGEETLVVWSAPSLITKWIAPRLGKYLAQNPRLRINVLNWWDSLDPFEGLADLEFTSGTELGPPNGRYVEQLFDEWIVPVIAPALFERAGGVADATLFGRVPMIYDIGDAAFGGGSWRDWLEATGYESVVPKSQMQFPANVLTLEAAAGGGGIALMRLSIALADIQSGRLIAPFDVVLHEAAERNIVRCAPASLKERKVGNFLNWLRAEAREYEYEVERFLKDKTVVTLNNDGKVTI